MNSLIILTQYSRLNKKLIVEGTEGQIEKLSKEVVEPIIPDWFNKSLMRYYLEMDFRIPEKFIKIRL